VRTHSFKRGAYLEGGGEKRRRGGEAEKRRRREGEQEERGRRGGEEKSNIEKWYRYHKRDKIGINGTISRRSERQQ
jgi:hypothetical protein